MPVDPMAIVRCVTEGARVVGRVVDYIRQLQEAGDLEGIRRVDDVLQREILRSREMLDDAEDRVTEGRRP